MQITANTTNSSAVLSNCSTTVGVANGYSVTGTNIPGGAQILGFDAISITLTGNCTGNATGETVTIYRALAATGTSLITPSAVANLTEGTQPLTSACQVNPSAAADLTNGTQALTSTCHVSPTAACDSLQTCFITSLRNIINVTAACALGTNWPFTAICIISPSATAAGFVAGQGLTVKDVIDEILVLWGLGCACDLHIAGSVLANLNASLQTLFARAHLLDYFNRDTLTLTTDSNGAVEINESSNNAQGPIQNCQDAVRLHATLAPLRPIPSKTEFENFVALYYGGAAPSGPRAYYLDRKQNNQSSPQGAPSNSIRLRLLITPPSAVQVDVDVSYAAPRYVWADYTNGTPLTLPDRYAESLLLPLMRKWATSHRYFNKPELKEEIDTQYNLAATILELLEPQAPALTNPKTQNTTIKTAPTQK